MKWYQHAAKNGNAYAQRFMGIMYADGLGVPQDIKEAVKWFQLAADNGDVGAQKTLDVLQKIQDPS